MFKKSLYTYSFIKTLYDKNRDYLDSFSPLIYNVIPQDISVSVKKIQEDVSKKYDLKFPTHLIKTVLTKGHRQKILESNKGKYHLTKKGVSLVTSIEDTTDVERRINALGTDLVSFFQAKGIQKTRGGVADLLQSFIDRNLCFLVDLLGTNGDEEIAQISRKDEVILLDYIHDAMESKPEHYNTLKELIYGSIISGLIHVRSTTELIEYDQSTFKNARIYLDSNIVFSAFGFHTKEIADSAIELLDLIKQAGLELWVFEFTVDEMCGVIKSYGGEQHKFIKGIKIDSILSNFKQRGLGISDSNEMIGSIENLLDGLEVTIDPTPEVNLKDYTSENEHLRGKIGANKVEKSLANINHDLAVIDHIRAYRGRSVRRVEDPKAIFLTADNSLHSVTLHSFNHIDKGTLPETILDRLFANILWLKNPSIDLPVNLVIASHSRDLLIDRNVWERFYAVLIKLKNKGEITVDQAATLFYKNQISEILRPFSKSDIENIDNGFVTDAIEKSIKVTEASNSNLEEEKKMLENSLFVSETKVEDGRRSSEQIIEIRKNIKREAKKSTVKYIHLTVFVISMLLTVFEGALLLFLNYIGNSWSAIIQSIVLGGFLFLVINWKICEYIKPGIYKKIYLIIYRKKEKILYTDTSK